MEIPPEHHRPTRNQWIFLILGLALFWALRSGRLVISSPSIHLTNYSLPSSGPTAEVHPEVLNLQESFARVAELVKPAVVSISTIHIEKAPGGGPEFYFGDPFQEFFQQFFGGQGGPQGGPQEGPPMQ